MIWGTSDVNELKKPEEDRSLVNGAKSPVKGNGRIVTCLVWSYYYVIESNF